MLQAADLLIVCRVTSAAPSPLPGLEKERGLEWKRLSTYHDTSSVTAYLKHSFLKVFQHFLDVNPIKQVLDQK